MPSGCWIGCGLGGAGRTGLKRRPAVGGASSTPTVPPWACVTAATIARPSPKEPPRSPRPRTKRANSSGRSSGAMPGPSSATTSSAEPSGSGRVLAVMCVAGGVWRSAFSIRLVATRWRSSRLPLTVRGPDVELEHVVAAGRFELARRLDHDVGEVERLAQRRMTGVSTREQQQVADQATHALCRAQSGLSRLAVRSAQRIDEQLEVREHACEGRAQLVRRVGDELALALERRLCLVAGVAERGQHPAERARELGDLVVGDRLREGAARVAGALDLTRGGRQLGDRRDRPARHQRPGGERERRAERGRRGTGSAAARQSRCRPSRAVGRTADNRRSPSAAEADRRGDDLGSR